MEERHSLRQEDRAVSLLQEHGMARLSEFIEQGVTAATISRMERKGVLIQLSRGLYQLPDAPLDVNHALAEAAKLVPNGIICLSSALAFHELTTKFRPLSGLPSAQGTGVRRLPGRVSRSNALARRLSTKGIQIHMIEKVPVRIYSPAKTIVDLFDHGRLQKNFYGSEVGLSEATYGMKEAIRLKKATPAEIARYAVNAKIWAKVVQPRLEALIVDA